MKRNITKFLAALALLVGLTIPMGMWGQTYQLATSISVGDVVLVTTTTQTVAKELDGISTGSTTYGIATDFTGTPSGLYTLTVEAGNTTGSYALKHGNEYLKWSSGNSLTTSTTKDNSSSWTISFNGNNAIIANVGNTDRKLVYNASSPRFACYTSSQTPIQLYKQSGASTVTAPTVTPNSQSFVNELEVTITPAEGTTAYYTTNGTDPDNSGTGYTTAHSFTINQTTEVRAIAYNGTESSSIVTKEYTKVTPLANIAALTANTSADTYYVTMDNAVVTYVNGNYAYIQDESGAVVMYKSSHGLTAGDVLNGTATVAYQLRNGNPQITNLSGVTPTSGTAPEPTVVAQSAWNYTFNNVLSQYFKVTGATITQSNNKYYVELGDDNVQLYGQGDANPVSVSDLNATYTIVGFPTVYTNNSGTTFELQIFVQPVAETTTRTPVVLTFSETNVTTDIVENFEEPTLTVTDDEDNPIEGLTITFASNNTEVATVDATTGEVTIHSYGTVVITATFAGNDDYLPAEASYTINVQDSSITTATGTINFGNNGTKINGASVTGIDDLGNTWTITTTGTTSFTQNANFSQVGKAAEPASSITFTTTLSQPFTFIAFSAKFGGYSETAGDVTLKVGETTVGTGSLNGTNDVIVESTSAGTGTVLTVTVTNIAKGVKCYYISYTYDMGTDPIISTPNSVNLFSDATSGDFNYEIINPVAGTTLVASTTTEWISNVIVDAVNSKVSFETTKNSSDEDREGTITLTYGTINKTVTIIQSKIDYVILPFVWEGGPKDDLMDITGVTANGLGTDYASNNAPYYIKLDTDGDYIQVKAEDCPAIVTIGVKMIGGATTSTITVQSSSDGENFQNVQEFTISGSQNDVLTFNTTNAFGTNDRFVRFVFTKGSNVGVGPIIISQYVETKTLSVNGYADDNVKDGYSLIASPVYVDPANIEGLTDGNFDLYYYDDAEELEWQNYKTKSFNLVPGKGYLYAKKASTTGETFNFTLTGPYIGNGEISLVAGWNLIGNPYSQTAYITGEYYEMNETGSEITVGEGNAIAAMQGIFVNAEQTGTMTFSTTNPNGKSNAVVMNLGRNRGNVIDRAIVRFNEGQQLPKFQLFENSTKLYIPQGNEDFAVVRSAAQGEMPVSFKASENGTYTLAVETENVEMDYLHLIDNMTGMDVDLLQTPNYTFEAKTNDYASRFRLVFSASNNGTSTAETFAFFNGTSWTVSNQGEATLQVVDVMGRLVSTEQINGNATINLNETAGIYMLRLVNGNDVKVQKIVVR